ncbi:MAG: GNAT family N-acetyltransferase [Euzebya sp.]
MTITVRDARSEEFEEIGRLTLQAYDGVGEMSPDYRRKLADTAGRVADGARVLVATEPDMDTQKVRGSVTFVEPGTSHLETPWACDAGFRMLAVDPSAQGRGIGTLLVHNCIDLAREHHRRRMVIYSMEWMSGAHRVYAASGFTRRADLDVMFPAGAGIAFQFDLMADANAHFPPPGPVPAKPPWYVEAWELAPGAQPLC